MFKNKNLISTIILSAGLTTGFLYFLYQKYNSFVNSNFMIWVITLLVGLIAIIIYVFQKIDNKKDAARTVLQEIRRAEKIISDYKEHGHFKFTKKIISTNSWADSIHYFIEEIPFENLDKISDLYSIGEYLDSIIKMVSDIKFDARVHDIIKKQAREQVEQQLNSFYQKIDDSPNNNLVGGSITGFMEGGERLTSSQQKRLSKIDIAVNLSINSIPINILFNEIVGKYEPIYNTDIVSKLKEIAKIK